MAELYFAKESYDLVGYAYNVFNKLKYGHHERNYQRAYAIELGISGYKFVRELPLRISYEGKNIGKYFLDFLINDQIVVELKVANDFHTSHIKQVLAYLKSINKKLGILILFTPVGVKYRRIVN